MAHWLLRRTKQQAGLRDEGCGVETPGGLDMLSFLSFLGVLCAAGRLSL